MGLLVGGGLCDPSLDLAHLRVHSGANHHSHTLPGGDDRAPVQHPVGVRTRRPSCGGALAAPVPRGGGAVSPVGRLRNAVALPGQGGLIHGERRRGYRHEPNVRGDLLTHRQQNDIPGNQGGCVHLHLLHLVPDDAVAAIVAAADPDNRLLRLHLLQRRNTLGGIEGLVPADQSIDDQYCGDYDGLDQRLYYLFDTKRRARHRRRGRFADIVGRCHSRDDVLRLVHHLLSDG
mmetsp:Transcript_11795/g.25532  ORF Transcript_11795/g.25532 Transcript_11795/m.25532 type:complete len:232 (-) Transcript_11795:1356-2051(-)